MNAKGRYESAREIYGAIGVDTKAAMEQLRNIPISMHCWQGDDVTGFGGVQTLSGGIQAAGNYPDRARDPRELMSGIKKALSSIPGKHRLSFHASHAIFEEGEKVDRDQPEPKHFAKWVEFVREIGLELDFNPTMFSHPRAENATLSSGDPKTRKFWIDHCRACIRIGQYFAEGLGTPCSLNMWIPDGFKDIPTDRTSPRVRLKDSLDRILDMDYRKEEVLVAVESKVLGTGMESCTVGSHGFYMNCTASRGVMCLLDSGHFHSIEAISDKISSMLLFSLQMALHVSRPVRWDSDHVVLSDDETREIVKKIVRNDPKRVLLALDFSDASINRIAARVVSVRNMQKVLLYIPLMPGESLAVLQEERRFTELMMLQEELKTYPFGDVWDHFCEENQVSVKEQWSEDVKTYEQEVLSRRS